MKWFYNLKISTKLICAFIIVALMAGIIGIVGVINILTISKNSIAYGISISDIANVGLSFQQEHSVIKDILLDKNDTHLQRNLETIKSEDGKISASLTKVEQDMQSSAGRQAYNSLNDNLTKYKEVRDKALDLLTVKQTDQAIALFYDQGTVPANGVETAINQLFQLKVSNTSDSTNAVTTRANDAAVLLIAIVLFASVLAIALGLLITRIIGKPIYEIVNAAEKIADGDLDVRVQLQSKDELGILAAAFRKMSHNINQVITKINFAAEQVAVGSRQLSNVSMELSQATLFPARGY